MTYKNCWYSKFKEDAKKYKVDIDGVTKMKKCEWKRTVKRQIRKSIEKQSMEKEANSSFKLIHQNIKNMEDKYLEAVGVATAMMIIKKKLEVWDIANNMRKEKHC